MGDVEDAVAQVVRNEVDELAKRLLGADIHLSEDTQNVIVDRICERAHVRA